MRIEELANLNSWWKFGKDFWRYDRELKGVKTAFVEFHRRKLEVKKGNIYILRGNRQSGKTTYLKQSILELLESATPASILYVSCDRLASRKELASLIDNFAQMNREAGFLHIFLDEITYLEDWNLELKAIADSNSIDRMAVVATGSNPTKLKEKTERLPGRRVEGNEYYFKPLAFREFVLHSIDKLAPRIESAEFADALKRLKKALESSSVDLEQDTGQIAKAAWPMAVFKEELDYLLNIYLLTGGFPAVINEYLARKYQEKREEIRNDLYETLVRMVLGDATKIGKSETITREIMKGVIKRYGSRYSFMAISKDVGLPHQTIIDYLETLENSFILQIVYPFDIFSGTKIKFKGDKKIYFSDPFIYHAVSAFISGMDGITVSKENLLGSKDKMIEAAVLNHLSQIKEVPYMREWKTHLGFFYSTATGKEIDFVYVRNDGHILGVEVKYREEAEKRFTGLAGIKECLVLTKNQFEEQGDTVFMPVSVFLALLKKSERLI